MRTARQFGIVLPWACFVVLALICPSGDLKAQEISAAQVRRSIERGTKYLLRSQLGIGGWSDVNQSRHPEGTTALVTLALLNAGLSPESREMQAAIERLVQLPNERLSTYVAALRIMVLAAADPKGQLYRREIKNDVDWLIEQQLKSGPAIGGWSYPLNNNVIADSSNAQYALLGLHEASKVGVKVPEKVWERALIYWDKCFNTRTGGFGYDITGNRVNGSMTCAGISSVIIAEENLANAKDYLKGGEVRCCRTNQNSEKIERALLWMAKHFSVRANPFPRGQGRINAKFYYLYGMERAARLAGRRFIGAHDWYREGAEHLVRSQNTDGSWKGTGTFGETKQDIATAFGLLFLAKGKRPIVVGKYKFGAGDDWNRHPQGVHYLTRELESQWKTKLNWQTIDGSRAEVQDLAETPVLFISGRDQLDLTPAQKRALKAYIENGNFIFAEANQGNGCGNNVAFDRKFRQLMAELFPDTPLEPIGATHPIWNSHFVLQPDPNWPVLGLQACCRTSVIYCPKSLTGHWQLNRTAILDQLPRRAKSQVQYAREIGVNIVSYATGRQVRDKLDLPQINNKAISVLNNRALVLPKLDHRGGSDDAPNAWRHVLRLANDYGLTVDMEKKLVSPVPEQLFDHPFVFMHGRNQFFFKNAEVEALAAYVKGGDRGFIFADSICSNSQFHEAFEKQIERIVPGGELKPIPSNHPIWTDYYGGQNISTVTITKPDRTANDGFARRRVTPQFKGIEIDGRYVVVYSPIDLSCALENATLSHCESYTREDAIKLALNVLLYRLRAD